MDAISLMIGVGIGLILVVIILMKNSSLQKFNTELQSNIQNLVSEKSRFQQSSEILNGEKEKLEKALEIIRNEQKLAEVNLNRSNLENRHLQEQLATQKEELTQLQERFKKEFEVLAQKILEEKSEKFTIQNEKNIGNILKPLEEKIKDFREKVETVNKEQIDRNSGLLMQIKQLSTMYDSMSKEAQNLTKALKADNKQQGNWGEMILESILQKSGLRKDYEYFTQETFNENGKSLRPDILVQLPDNKQIIIDSKVSLIAYESAVNAASEEEAQSFIRQHIQSIRQHVKGLSEKNYQQIKEIKTLDFVLLFIPIEPAFLMAIHEDQRLFQEAFDKNIILVSPTTLLATLRTISSIWKQEYQTRNTIEIATQAGRLYDKFVSFIEDLKSVGTKIEQTQSSYLSAMNKLQTGKGNLITRAQKLKELGANTSKSIPSELLDEEL